MEPAPALARIAFLLERDRAPTHKVQAFRRAFDTVVRTDPDELRRLAGSGRLQALPGVGKTIESVISEALAGQIPAYLARVDKKGPDPDSPQSKALVAALRGDCHTHTTWSDGGSSVAEMAVTARSLGLDYLVVTDHSPSLTVARGLTAERLTRQQEEIAAVNDRLQPSFRVLTGVEVDILEDGSLDHPDEVLEGLDVVVASVHRRFGQSEGAMTARLVAAVANPQVDVLGHPTGRMVEGKRRRPPYDFDQDLVFAAAARFDTAIEFNCRPERLDPPPDLVATAKAHGVWWCVNTDAHAPGQLAWSVQGCDRLAAAGVGPDRVVNALGADALMAWCSQSVTANDPRTDTRPATD